MRSASEPLAPFRRQHEPRAIARAAGLEADEAVGDGVLPDRQMRATASPRLRVGITARRLIDPGEELLRQSSGGGGHGLEFTSRSAIGPRPNTPDSFAGTEQPFHPPLEGNYILD